MNRILPAAIALLASTSLGLAQELPAGPPVAITMVTQLSPTIPQYTASTSRCCARSCRSAAAGAFR